MGIYQNCYDLIHQYIYGSAELTANMDLVCVLIATAASLFVVALPFCIVWKIVRMIANL